MRFTRWKVKLQRVSGYVSLATFLIVLLQLVRDLYASPYVPWRPDDFTVFFLLAIALSGAVFLLLAELDWRLVFPAEIGVSHSRDPMFFSTAFRDAAVLHGLQGDNPQTESILRNMYRSVGREREWDEALEMVRR